jgi:hypothetical protein
VSLVKVTAHIVQHGLLLMSRSYVASVIGSSSKLISQSRQVGDLSILPKGYWHPGHNNSSLSISFVVVLFMVNTLKMNRVPKRSYLRSSLLSERPMHRLR